MYILIMLFLYKDQILLSNSSGSSQKSRFKFFSVFSEIIQFNLEYWSIGKKIQF